jgi:putative hydrolase of the HAD superfamily
MTQMQINGKQLKMVFFDAGGTLFDVAEPVGNTYSRLAQQFGKKVAPELLQRNFLTAFKLTPPLAFKQKLSAEDLAAAESQWWFRLVSEVFVGSGEFKYFEEFFAEAYSHYAQTKAWELFDDVLPTLEILRSQSIKIGALD